ncbi:MAG: ABC transporter permease [Spirochaetales bacterium]|nr:ABC transporter permease [Spirochaetales bacterium]
MPEEQVIPPVSSDQWQRLTGDIAGSEEALVPSLSYSRDVLRRLKADRPAMLGGITVVVLIVAAFFGPLFSNHSYFDQNLSFANVPPILAYYQVEDDAFVYLHKNLKLIEVSSRGRLIRPIPMIREDGIGKKMFFQVAGRDVVIDYSKRPPELTDGSGVPFDIYRRVWSREYLLGTDPLGRDLFIRVLYGTRISLLVAFVATAVNFIIGILYGGISGYIGGKTDNLMMRIVDIISTIPLTLYVILIMVVLDSGFLSIIIALGSVYWVNMARIVRGQMLSLKEQEFVLAARTIGSGTGKILFKHLLPNAMGVITVTATMLIPSAIFIEAFLSFIGLGVSAPKASLGTLSSDALSSLRTFPYQLFSPALAICIIMFAFNFLGDGLRDALDPKLRK